MTRFEPFSSCAPLPGRPEPVGCSEAGREASRFKVIGLMSGTSVDGIDAVLVELTGTQVDLKVNLLAGATYPYPDTLRSAILAVCGGASLTLEALTRLDDAIAQALGQAALAIQTGFSPADLIGSHGQTVYHRPPEGNTQGYSIQLGRGEAIAQLTGIPTISNFRAADIAAGGHGAPLVSRVDAYMLGHDNQTCCVQNIGGISNVTFLPARNGHGSLGDWENHILGWDTGPGNMLLDLAVHHFSQGAMTYDRDGAWAAQGRPHLPLVWDWLAHPFFQTPPPKSTGREVFGEVYWQACLAATQSENLGPADVLATLTEFTALAIVESYRHFLPQLPNQVLLCGGGCHNHYLQARLQTHLNPIPVEATDRFGLNADFKEAIAFAILAYWHQHKLPGNLPRVTGAKQAMLLGEIRSPH